MTSNSGHAHVSGSVVWSEKPYVIPAAIYRTATIVVTAIFALFAEMWLGVALTVFYGLPLYLWTLFVFTLIWALSLLELLLFWAKNTYLLREDGLEVRRGIIRLNSLVVTPSGFGDLMLYQSLGGRIFGYGDLTVNSQGARQTKLKLVRSPFEVAEVIRGVMGKPAVRVEARR